MQNMRNRLVKIGFSKKPRLREKTLQSEEPEIQLIDVVIGTKSMERDLHSYFERHRVRGEWFDFSNIPQSEWIDILHCYCDESFVE